jgi:membrane-bound lytic murein transglycosylase A
MPSQDLSPPLIRAIAIAALALAAAAVVVVAPPAAAQAAPAPSAEPAAEAPREARPAEPPADASFRTRYAYFVPARFDELPGWRDDNLADAWIAFRASCAVLDSRSAWAGPCARSRRVGARDADVRAFLEREFTLYQIHDVNQSPSGVITGYYEPLLRGSRRYGDPYIYPVYGVPRDLLYLDSRSLPRTAPGGVVYGRVDGRAVIPMCVDAQAGPACQGPYRIELGAAKPDVRDKRVRVRIDGQRIVPYYTRAEIEQGALASEVAIVWVDDVAMLYSMQVQGSGKIRLPDGQIMRLAFGEQNGHPFQPPIRNSAKRARGSTVLTRGLDIPLSGEDEDDDIPPDFSRSEVPVLRGVGPVAAPAPANAPAPASASAPARAASVAPRAATPEAEMSPEVARMVDLLLKGNDGAVARPAPAASATPPVPAPAAGPAPAPAAAVAPPAPPAPPAAVTAAARPTPALPPRPEPKSVTGSAPSAAPTAASPTPAPAAATVAVAAPAQLPSAPAVPAGPSGGPVRPSAFSGDPSYVFFRQIPDGDGGPIGALGVPLTPGRSVAVDPRTTPLGFPVFISTVGPRSTVNRLMLAQDTGGAIRGAVRADYFWGFGSSAGELASRMKENGRMWLLLPRDLQIAAGTGPLTRGVGGVSDAECLVPDPELCVE